jgi:hypothetical protein
VIATSKPRRPLAPALRGFQAIYDPNAVNHCPGCGKTQWLVGRITAECAFCETAIPLIDSRRPGSSIVQHKNRERGRRV